MNNRLQALKILLPADTFLTGKPLNLKNATPFTKDLCFKVCRHYFALEKIIGCLLKKPLKAKDQDLAIILYIGIVQIEFMDVKNHAAVSECVELASQIGKKSAKGLINACLRHYLDDQKNLARIFDLPKYQAPEWLLNQLKADYPKQWQNIIVQNQEHAPMFIRVAGNVDEYIKRLDESGIGAEKTASNCGLKLLQPVPIEALPGFENGDCSVQDLSPQMAAGLFKLEDGHKVLDACAAPGNKSAHLLETANIELHCLDVDAKRLARLEENLKRCKKTAKTHYASADDLDAWWDGQAFDRILLDAPCSATGVIRRHPDIQILRTAEEVETLNKTQLSVLTKLWQTLKPGGLLLYATCSILPSENDRIIDAFLKQEPTATVQELALPFGHKTELGWQVLPGDDDADGFYYARLIKN